MATYFFETITDAQAAAYNAAADTLVFGTTGETAWKTTVRFNPATATSSERTGQDVKSESRIDQQWIQRTVQSECCAIPITKDSTRGHGKKPIGFKIGSCDLMKCH